MIDVLLQIKMAAKTIDIKLGLITGVLGSAAIHFQVPSSSSSSSSLVPATAAATAATEAYRDCQMVCSITGPHYNTSGGGQTVGNLSHSYMDSAAIDQKGSINVQISGISEYCFERDNITEVQLAYMIRCALLPFIFIEKYKGCFFQIACVVRGDIRPSRCLDIIINCCGLALLNSCIEVKDVVTAVTNEILSDDQGLTMEEASGSSSTNSSSSSISNSNNDSRNNISNSNSNNSNSSSTNQIPTPSPQPPTPSPQPLTPSPQPPSSFITTCYSCHMKSITLLHSTGAISEADVCDFMNRVSVPQCKELRDTYRSILRIRPDEK